MTDQTDNRRWIALAVIVVAQFMVVLDVAIVNVALPSIKTDLNFSEQNLQWVITAYSILFGGVLLLGGRLADILGRRKLFIAGIALFTVSSLLDGLAWSEGSLIAFRALQGLGAALVSPAALSILTTTFAEGRERNRALGIWGAVSGSGAAAGVLLGGALTSAFSWSWIFFVNVPVGLLVLVLSPLLLRESRADLADRHFDVSGAAAITGGLMLLVYALTRATTQGWGSGSTIALLAALYMQQVLHYSALKTGVAYVGITLTIIIVSAVAQALATRIGVRPLLPLGMALAAVALVLYARLPVHGHYFTDLFPAFIIGGVGMALVFVPMSIGALTGVRADEAGIASGLINTSQQIGGAIGVAVASTIAATYTSHYVNAHSGSTAASGAALTHGFAIAFWVLAGIAVVGGILGGLLVESRPRAEQTEDVGVPAFEEAA